MQCRWAASGRGREIVPGRSTRSLEVMLGASFGVLVVATIAFITLSGFFLEAVQREAPQLFDAWGKPSIGRYLWQRKLFMPFSEIVLTRAYRRELANYPASRAWASWLFIAHWIQLMALAVCVVAVVRG